jgi:hypothetical protein
MITSEANKFSQKSWVSMEATLQIHMPCAILAILYHIFWSKWWVFAKLIVFIKLTLRLRQHITLESSMAY